MILDEKQNTTTDRTIALIGAGGIVSDAHLPAYEKAGYTVAAIFDLDGDKAKGLAEQYGIERVCVSLSEWIEVGEEKGCVYDIALPASAIIEVLQQLPDQAGVLIQKPMGENYDQAQAILEICRRKRLVAGINFQLRHAPYVVEAKKIIDSGQIGDLHDVDVRLNVNTPWHLWKFMYTIPRLEILYHSIHYIDMVRYFLGDPQRVLAKTTKHPNDKGLAATRSSIILDYGDVVRANINTNHGHDFGSKHQESYFKFEGTKGAIKIKVGVYLDYPKGLPDEMEYITSTDDKGWRKVPLQGSWFPDAFVGPMAGLMAKLNDSSYPYINDVEDAINTMKLVEDCYSCSAETKP